MIYIYKITFGKYVYIGSTKNIRRRYTSHRSHCFNSNQKRYNKKLYKQIRDCGITRDTFDDEVKMIILTSTINIFGELMEEYHIKKYSNYKYNLNTVINLNTKKIAKQTIVCPCCEHVFKI